MADRSAVWSPQEMRARYGDFYDKGVFLVLDDRRIPEVVRPIKHYAEFWAPLHESDAEDLAAQAPPQVARNLMAVVKEFDSHLDDWLAGEEAARPGRLSREYLAYTDLRMAYLYLLAIGIPEEETI